MSRYVQIRSLQCVEITCKFTERFLRNRSFCRGTFYLAAPCIFFITFQQQCNFTVYTFHNWLYQPLSLSYVRALAHPGVCGQRAVKWHLCVYIPQKCYS